MAHSDSVFTHVPALAGHPDEPLAQDWQGHFLAYRSPQPLAFSVPSPPVAEWHNSPGGGHAASPLPLTPYTPAGSPSIFSSPVSSISSVPTSRSSTPSSCSSPSPKRKTCAPPKPKKKTVSRRAAKDPNHIPRPPNAFILFRMDKCAELRTVADVEHDHRMISKIIGEMWKAVPKDVKQYYADMAAARKAEHLKQYPNYRFSPKQRTVPAKKRKVKRNGPMDLKRCALVAKLVGEKAKKERIEQELKEFDEAVNAMSQQTSANRPADDYTTNVFDSKIRSAPHTPLLDSGDSSSDETPFRSPLFPPATPPPTTECMFTSPSESLSPLCFQEPQALVPHPVSLPDQSPMGYPIYAPAIPFGGMHDEEHGSLSLSNMYDVLPTLDCQTSYDGFGTIPIDQQLLPDDAGVYQPQYHQQSTSFFPAAEWEPYTQDQYNTAPMLADAQQAYPQYYC